MEEFAAGCGVGLEVADAEVKFRDVFDDVADGEDAGDKLGDHRGEPGPRRPHLEADDEEDVEDDVGDAAGDQEVERGLGVAEGAEHVGQDVVERGRSQARENPHQVAVGVADDGGVCPQELQDEIEEDESKRGLDGGETHKQDEAVAEATLDAGHVAGAEPLGGKGGEPRRHALDRAHEKPDETAAGADGGEGVDAEGAADDHRVHRVVEPVEQAAEKVGDGEEENQLRGVALEKVLGHCFGLARWLGLSCEYGQRRVDRALAAGISEKAVSPFLKMP